MKTFITTVLLIYIIGNIGAVDIESYHFIDHLRSMSAPVKPEIYGDGVLFTASSSYNRVGISFAYEGYAKVYWFKRFMVPRDRAEVVIDGKIQKNVNPNRDSGIMFHVQPIPGGLKNMDYRMIIDGLWTVDPMNPLTVTGPSGIAESRIPLAASSGDSSEQSFPADTQVQSGTYRFSCQGPPGETVTVAGSFNSWDPFMYEMQETSPGFYTLTLPLPPGTFQYVFFQRGEQIPDRLNAKSIYTRDGRIVSEAVVR